MSQIIERLNWRYATKNFDPSQPLSKEDEDTILESIRLAPTSFGLQPFRVRLVRDPGIKEKIKNAGWGQPQYEKAPLLLVFTTLPDMDQRVTDYIELASGGDEEKKKAFEGYENMMRGFVKNLDAEKTHSWAARQAYIALGFAMATCAELKIDSCPMEGFSPADVDQILELPEGEKSCVLLCVGYRSESENLRGKTRFSKDTLFLEV